MKKELASAHRDDYYSVEEAAKALRSSIQGVRNHLMRGVLTRYRFKTATLISVAEVKEYLRKKRGE